MTEEQLIARRERQREWTNANREKVRAYKHKYEAAHGAKKREWYLANRTAVLAKNTAYHKAHPEVARRASRKWRLANPDKHRAAQKKWELENPGRVNQLARQWRIKNQKKIRAQLGYPEPTRPRPDLCECCGGPPTGHAVLHLDHCHATKKFRGWLCGKCNVGLGMFRDSTALLQAAMKYLRSIDGTR